MAERKRNWMWRRLAEGPEGKNRRPTNYRRPDYMINKQGETVRYHAPHPMTPGLIRFLRKTERVFIDPEDACIVWTGGDTFRVDGATVTTPARYYWEAFTGEKLKPADVLYRTCKTPRCVKHKVKK